MLLKYVVVCPDVCIQLSVDTSYRNGSVHVSKFHV